MTACPACHYDPDATVTACWRFFLPITVPSQNRSHLKGPARFAYKKHRDECQLLVRAAKMRIGIADAIRPRRVTLRRFYSGRGRLMDDANFRAGCKALVDSLVREELLVDDAPAWMTAYYHQERHEHLSGVEICVEEVKDGT